MTERQRLSLTESRYPIWALVTVVLAVAVVGCSITAAFDIGYWYWVPLAIYFGFVWGLPIAALVAATGLLLALFVIRGLPIPLRTLIAVAPGWIASAIVLLFVAFPNDATAESILVAAGAGICAAVATALLMWSPPVSSRFR